MDGTTDNLTRGLYAWIIYGHTNGLVPSLHFNAPYWVRNRRMNQDEPYKGHAMDKGIALPGTHRWSGHPRYRRRGVSQRGGNLPARATVYRDAREPYGQVYKDTSPRRWLYDLNVYDFTRKAR